MGFGFALRRKAIRILKVKRAGRTERVMRYMGLGLVFALCFMLDFGGMTGAQAASPLECGLTQMGVRSHIECVVGRERLQIKQVQLNNGECRTMQEHVELNPKERDRLKGTIGYPLASLDYRRSYRAGEKFIVYLMPCRLREYMIETDQGTWGWIAPRQ
jgi:hypothetical protein